MKRSEMIKKMIEVLEETKTCPDDIKVKSILAMQMEAGMEPPPHQERQGSGYADEYGMEESYDVWVEGWEQE